MKEIRSEDVRAHILERFREPLKALGLSPEEVPEDFDLLSEGIIDSLGILEMISTMEEHFGIELDYEELDPEDLTILGPFCRFVAERSGRENT